MRQALEQYPPEFLQALAGQWSLRICLVGQVEGLPGAAYWEDGQPTLLIGLGPEVRNQVHRQLWKVAETWLFGRTRALDGWQGLNPEGFGYDYSYAGYSLRRSEYLQPGSLCFADSLGMTYPTEDRAGVWMLALEEGNGHAFRERALQQKLQALCLAMREGCGWQDSSQTFPWEQYLAPKEE